MENREINEFRKINFSAWQVTNEIFWEVLLQGNDLLCNVNLICLSLASDPRTTIGKYAHTETVVFYHRQLFNTVPPTELESSFPEKL